MADIGSTFTKGLVVSLESGEILCGGQTRTTSETDIGIGFEKIKDELLARSGAAAFRLCLASSSAKGGLRVVALGLMPDLTVKAAKAACLNAGAKLLSCYSHKISTGEAAAIERSAPDVIFLAGGTDGGDKECVLHNARVLAGMGGDAVILFAGNKEALDETAAMFKDKDVFYAENVLPGLDRLNIEPAREKLREIFLERIVSAKGLNGVAERIDGRIEPTPYAVMNAVALLSKGIRGCGGWGEFVAVDAGGATTDVYSAASGGPAEGCAVFRGVPEPFLKRTVEGDLGLRLSIGGLVSLHGGEKPGESCVMRRWTEKAASDYSRLPGTEEEVFCDAVLAGLGAMAALVRHCGSLTEHYTPAGRVFIQTGKDLRGVRKIAASGGVFAYNPRAAGKLECALKENSTGALTPSSAKVMPDRSYVLYAAGLLSRFNEEAAFLTMEKSFSKNGT